MTETRGTGCADNYKSYKAAVSNAFIVFVNIESNDLVIAYPLRAIAREFWSGIHKSTVIATVGCSIRTLLNVSTCTAHKMLLYFKR